MKKNQKILFLLPLIVLIYRVIMNIQALTQFSLEIIMQVHLPLCLLALAVYLSYRVQNGFTKGRFLSKLFSIGYLAANISPYIQNSFLLERLTVLGIVNVFILPLLAVVFLIYKLYQNFWTFSKNGHCGEDDRACDVTYGIFRWRRQKLFMYLGEMLFMYLGENGCFDAENKL